MPARNGGGKTIWHTMPGFATANVFGALLASLVDPSRMAYAALIGLGAIPKPAVVPILIV